MTPRVLTCVVVVTVCVALCGASNLYRTRGLSSHKKCGDVFCLWREARCEDQRCVCQSGRGLGAFSCSEPASTTGGLFTEPNSVPSVFHYRTVHSPCRYLLVHVQSDMMEGEDTLGLCDIKVHAWERRTQGRYHVAGTDITVHMRTWAGEEKEESVTWMAGGRRGVYSWQVSPRVVKASPGWGTRPCMDLAVDGSNNRARVMARMCGFHMAFRPIDTKLVNQTHLAGINFDASHSYLPVWKSLDTAMLVPPPDHESLCAFGLFDECEPSQSKAYTVLSLPESVNHTLMERVLNGGVNQHFPGVPRSCVAAQNSAEHCTTTHARDAAFKTCNFILETDCYKSRTSGAMNQVMKLFSQCLQSQCTRNIALCEKVVTEVKGQCADVKTGMLDWFLIECYRL